MDRAVTECGVSGRPVRSIRAAAARLLASETPTPEHSMRKRYSAAGTLYGASTRRRNGALDIEPECFRRRVGARRSTKPILTYRDAVRSSFRTGCASWWFRGDREVAPAAKRVMHRLFAWISTARRGLAERPASRLTVDVWRSATCPRGSAGEYEYRLLLDTVGSSEANIRTSRFFDIECKMERNGCWRTCAACAMARPSILFSDIDQDRTAPHRGVKRCWPCSSSR